MEARLHRHTRSGMPTDGPAFEIRPIVMKLTVTVETTMRPEAIRSAFDVYELRGSHALDYLKRIHDVRRFFEPKRFDLDVVPDVASVPSKSRTNPDNDYRKRTRRERKQR